MSVGYSGKRFECPFFKWDEAQKLHCEGCVVTLPGPELRRFINRYCCDIKGWEDCPIAKELVQYYDK